MGDQYINAEILLPRGDKMARGQVVCQEHHANGNLISGSSQNPIVVINIYEVKFSGEEIVEHAANIIAESMYAQCDVNGNEYLLLKAFIDYRKNGSALSVEDQKIVVKG